MITCRFCIEFRADPEHRGMSVAIIPTPTDTNDAEGMMWRFFNIMIACANNRTREQIVNNQTADRKNTYIEATSEGSKALVKEQLAKQGLAQRETAVVNFSFTKEGGPQYLLGYVVGHQFQHPLEELVWGTYKRALDVGTDWMMREEGGISYLDYEEDQRALRELLEEELAKLPVWPDVREKTL
jgi:hypothetical protein